MGQRKKNEDDRHEAAAIGSRLREARESLGITQAQLSEGIGGRSQEAVRAYESGRARIPLSIALRICRHLGLRLVWLAEGVPPRFLDEERSQQGFFRDRATSSPTKADEELLRLLQDVESMYLHSNELQREALIMVIGSILGLLGRVSADDPSRFKARSARVYLNFGVVAQQEGKFDEALNYYKSALALDATEETKQRIETVQWLIARREHDTMGRRTRSDNAGPESGDRRKDDS